MARQAENGGLDSGSCLWRKDKCRHVRSVDERDKICRHMDPSRREILQGTQGGSEILSLDSLCRRGNYGKAKGGLQATSQTRVGNKFVCRARGFFFRALGEAFGPTKNFFRRCGGENLFHLICPSIGIRFSSTSPCEKGGNECHSPGLHKGSPLQDP